MVETIGMVEIIRDDGDHKGWWRLTEMLRTIRDNGDLKG